MGVDDLPIDDELHAAQNALNRLRRAYERGTGCRLTAEMVAELYLTRFGETWEQSDPRSQPKPSTHFHE